MSQKMERFTQRARKVLSLSQDAAARLKHDSIKPEHILIGLIQEGQGVAGQVLTYFELDQQSIEGTVQLLSSKPPTLNLIEGHTYLAPETKKLLEYSVDEARRMGHWYIGTEHLLLGLLRLRKGIAIDTLKKLGVNLEEIHRVVKRVLGDQSSYVEIEHIYFFTPEMAIAIKSFTQRSKDILQSAYKAALRLQDNYISTDHLLIAFVQEDAAVTSHVFRRLGLDSQKVETTISQFPKEPATDDQQLDLTRDLKQVLEYTVKEAQRTGQSEISTDYLLRAFIDSKVKSTEQLLTLFGLTREKIHDTLKAVLSEESFNERVVSDTKATTSPSTATSETRTFPLAHQVSDDVGNLLTVADKIAQAQAAEEITLSHLLAALTQAHPEWKIIQSETDDNPKIVSKDDTDDMPKT